MKTTKEILSDSYRNLSEKLGQIYARLNYGPTQEGPAYLVGNVIPKLQSDLAAAREDIANLALLNKQLHYDVDPLREEIERLKGLLRDAHAWMFIDGKVSRGVDQLRSEIEKALR